LDYAADPGTASRLVAMTLGVGYLLSALGPFGVGALRDATGGYEVPFISLAALAIFMLVLALLQRPQALRRD
jgi:MFS transporter, CP family, cyanate transporter